MKRKKHYWLVMYRAGVGSIFGSFLESKRQLREYLSGGYPDKYEDRELEVDEIFEYLRKMKRFRTPGYGFSVIEFEG